MSVYFCEIHHAEFLDKEMENIKLCGYKRDGSANLDVCHFPNIWKTDMGTTKKMMNLHNERYWWISSVLDSFLEEWSHKEVHLWTGDGPFIWAF